MKVRKFCLCGVKLERDVTDEDTAREIITRFRFEHSGAEHGPTDERGYRRAISKIIRGNTRKRVSLETILPASASPHSFENRMGLEVCSVCLVIKSAVSSDCKGAALILARDAVPVLIRR
jgi:hypothetical protein